MILVRLMGGLGNQMFQYAYAKHISLFNNVPLKLDVSLLGNDDKLKDRVVRNFDLDLFSIQEKETFATVKEIEKFNGKESPSFIDRVIFKLKKLYQKENLLLQEGNKQKEHYLNLKTKSLCVVGRWQSESFFSDNVDEIKKLFSFDKFVSNSYSLDVSEKMGSQTTIVIHVRRKDYITHPDYSKTLGGLDQQYYRDAIDFMETKLSMDSSKKYFFISDDINWCKENFKDLKNVFFVEQEKDKLGFFSDLWLLSKGDHSIISNSTFAWWGAWLGEKENSTVVAPLNWTRYKEYSPDNIVPDRWVTLANNFEKLA